MKIEISKEEFEVFVPVAKAASSAVYDSVVPRLQEYVDETEEMYLGETGCAAVTKDEGAMRAMKRYVAVLTFLMMMEQRDVVLTPTGFGVVSNDQVAPASSGRVAAVQEALHRDMLIAFDRLISMMTKVEGWGLQECAANAISLPLWSMRQMMHQYGNRLSVEKFNAHIESERSVMQEIRGWIGDKTVDFCLEGIRCNRHDEYTKLTKIIVRIVVAAIDGDMVTKDSLYHNLMLVLERHLETYTLYAESDEYQANISERYENKQEDSAFFFG